jgi:hypothetical protein
MALAREDVPTPCVTRFAAWTLSSLTRLFQQPRAFFTFLLAAHLLKSV